MTWLRVSKRWVAALSLLSVIGIAGIARLLSPGSQAAPDKPASAWLPRLLISPTRPRPPKYDGQGVRLLDHLSLPLSNSSARCYAHGVYPYTPGTRQTKRFPPRKVFDVVLLVDDRVELVEIRMRELREVVDIFVIVESETTLDGRPRTARYEDYSATRLNWLGRRVHYYTALVEGPDSRMRSLISATNEAIDGIRIPAASLVIQSLADDIPSAGAIELIRNCTYWPWPVRLQLRGQTEARFPNSLVEPLVMQYLPRDTTFAGTRSDDDDEPPGSTLPEAGWHWPDGMPSCGRAWSWPSKVLPALPAALDPPRDHLQALATPTCTP